MNVNCQNNLTTLCFAKGDVQEMITTYGFPAHTPYEKSPSLEVNDYQLTFNLNGVLVAMGEGQTITRLIILKPGLKEFLSTCVKKKMVYIWSYNEENFFKTLGNYRQEY